MRQRGSATTALAQGATEEERQAFFQTRVAMAGLVGAALGGSFLLFRLVVGIATGYGRGLSLWTLFAEPSIGYHFGGVVPLLGMWLSCRRGQRSQRTVEWIEALGVVGSCAMYSMMGMYIPPSSSPELVVTLALTHGMFARAIYVPSTARRSLLLGLLVAVPHLAAVWWHWRHVPPEYGLLVKQIFADVAPADVALFQAIGAGMWWLLTVAGTTAASRVIFGLRQEVRDVQRLGQYELLDKIGEGGMGVVYRARHALLQRPTAVKLLPPSRIGEHTLARFEREVRLTAKLTHPNTITVYDYGRTTDGVFYYAMELLDDGATLSAVIAATGPMPPARVVHVLTQATAALAEAHEAGLIHRDIKPENIMLCRRGGVEDTVKVLDFGLVKELEDSAAVSMAGSQIVVGTPHYMAPEMLIAPAEVDARTDLYALGVVAFHLLTGEQLFDAKTVMEVCGQHLHATARRAKEVASQPVPAGLDALIAACLEKDPADRPQSARALRQALLELGLPAWTTGEAARWWQDHGEAVERRKTASLDDEGGLSILRPAPRRPISPSP